MKARRKTRNNKTTRRRKTDCENKGVNESHTKVESNVVEKYIDAVDMFYDRCQKVKDDSATGKTEPKGS